MVFSRSLRFYRSILRFCFGGGAGAILVVFDRFGGVHTFAKFSWTVSIVSPCGSFIQHSRGKESRKGFLQTFHDLKYIALVYTHMKHCLNCFGADPDLEPS